MKVTTTGGRRFKYRYPEREDPMKAKFEGYEIKGTSVEIAREIRKLRFFKPPEETDEELIKSIAEDIARIKGTQAIELHGTAEDQAAELLRYAEQQGLIEMEE